MLIKQAKLLENNSALQADLLPGEYAVSCNEYPGNTLVMLADKARDRASHYRGCSAEQSMTYACEDVVVNELGARIIHEKDMKQWLDDVCDDEDIDTPLVIFNNRKKKTIASVDVAMNVMCVQRETNTAVLLHEIAHLVAASQEHGHVFRSETVRLWRKHLSVEHGALLHSLFGKVQLTVDPWQALK